MKASLLRLALLATMLVPAAPVLAADLEPPPPLLPATFDWTGIHAGAFVAANAFQGHYDAHQICGCGPHDPEMSGIGYGFGLKAGADYQLSDNFVLGIAGDWTWGVGKQATNNDPAEATYLRMNDLGTLRARAGYADGNTLFYVTGGAAMANMEFGGKVGPAPGVDSSEKQWTYGWTVGGGIEHAFSDQLSGYMEYLYVKLDPTKHFLSDGKGNAGTIKMKYEDTHTIRAGLNYRFSL